MIPETDPLKTYKLAALMKDGRAAKRKDIDYDFNRPLAAPNEKRSAKPEWIKNTAFSTQWLLKSKNVSE